MVIQSHKVKKETSKPTSSWMQEDDEPLIEKFDYARFLDRHYDIIEPGVSSADSSMKSEYLDYLNPRFIASVTRMPS